MHNKIKEIANFQTYFGKLQDNIPVASLILPSGMRSYKYPNSFKVNPSNGVVTLKSKEKSKIVPNNVIKESSSVIFRSACQKNQKHMSELTFESGMLWGFEQALVDWMYYLPSEYKHATLYGGEILCNDMLSNICYAMQRTPDIKMVIYTYNDEAVKFVRNKKIIPDNLIVLDRTEWDYKIEDKVKFKFPNTKEKFIVPVESYNYKVLCKHS